jgi:hypothetical protein
MKNARQQRNKRILVLACMYAIMYVCRDLSAHVVIKERGRCVPGDIHEPYTHSQIQLGIQS